VSGSTQEQTERSGGPVFEGRNCMGTDTSKQSASTFSLKPTAGKDYRRQQATPAKTKGCTGVLGDAQRTQHVTDDPFRAAGKPVHQSDIPCPVFSQGVCSIVY